jgi:arylsulfatase A
MKILKIALCFFLLNSTAFAQTKKPNIIFILADDLGIDGVSSYGADLFKTPIIDKLAKEGIRFTNAYTAPLCGPSRAMILTGRYAFRTGAVNQDQTAEFTPAMETMMPKILKPAGYTSAMIGKWGQLPLGPGEFGFDEYLRFYGSGVFHNKPDKKEKYVLNGKDLVLKDNVYMPDLMHNTMVDFVSKHTKDPFYLYYSLVHVHGEIMATPDTKPGTTDYQGLYNDNINYMDKLVGKLIKTLDSLKIRDNTLIVFFGDNGTAGQAATIGTVNGKTYW